MAGGSDATTPSGYTTRDGERLSCSTPHRLRVCCDGDRCVCLLDDEPVLGQAVTDYRTSARPLVIRWVRLTANGEWGDETGTLFGEFEALGHAASGAAPRANVRSRNL